MSTLNKYFKNLKDNIYWKETKNRSFNIDFNNLQYFDIVEKDKYDKNIIFYLLNKAPSGGHSKYFEFRQNLIIYLYEIDKVVLFETFEIFFDSLFINDNEYITFLKIHNNESIKANFIFSEIEQEYILEFLKKDEYKKKYISTSFLNKICFIKDKKCSLTDFKYYIFNNINFFDLDLVTLISSFINGSTNLQFLKLACQNTLYDFFDYNLFLKLIDLELIYSTNKEVCKLLFKNNQKFLNFSHKLFKDKNNKERRNKFFGILCEEIIDNEYLGKNFNYNIDFDLASVMFNYYKKNLISKNFNLIKNFINFNENKNINKKFNFSDFLFNILNNKNRKYYFNLQEDLQFIIQYINFSQNYIKIKNLLFEFDHFYNLDSYDDIFEKFNFDFNDILKFQIRFTEIINTKIENKSYNNYTFSLNSIFHLKNIKNLYRTEIYTLNDSRIYKYFDNIVKFFNIFNILYFKSFNFDVNQKKLIIEAFDFIFNTLQNYNFDSNLLIDSFSKQIKLENCNLETYIFNKDYFITFMRLITFKEKYESQNENNHNYNLHDYFQFCDILWILNILTIIKQFIFLKKKILNLNYEYDVKLNNILKIYNNIFLKNYNFNIINNIFKNNLLKRKNNDREIILNNDIILKILNNYVPLKFNSNNNKKIVLNFNFGTSDRNTNKFYNELKKIFNFYGSTINYYMYSY